MHDVVLDTNVLVAALRSRRGASFQLFGLLGKAPFRPHVSVALALEYEDVLKRVNLVPGFDTVAIDYFLDYIFNASVLAPSVISRRPRLHDPNDELVLDLASQCHGTIITYNRKDFSVADAMGIEVQSPREFLDVLKWESE